ncbi:uncharacterized protein JCM6883_004578 [Sporobolomyces salmoneus]|uniref:uncharacterized protein n=1 Tax=Sporobolomyces salmoneus TaxID=183962 RepID=UPI0031747422
MDQNDLESLLASLRQQQDPPAPPVAPSNSHHHSTPVPSQDQLDALLNSLTALPDSTLNNNSPAPAAAPTRTRDYSNLTFPESLPILHSLATDTKFLDSIEAMWDEQKNWELRMKDERNRLEQEAIRAGHNPQMRGLKLKDWDKTALKKWEKLQTSQQEKLQALGVPTFQPTRDQTVLKRQERVMKVLVGFVEDREDAE